MTDDQKTAIQQDAERVTALETWLRMCCESTEFVANYNRLNGTKLSFTLPMRKPIEQMVDRATGHVPTLNNDEAELDQFFGHCRDLLLQWPGLDDPKNFRESA